MAINPSSPGCEAFCDSYSCDSPFTDSLQLRGQMTIRRMDEILDEDVKVMKVRSHMHTHAHFTRA